MLILVSRYAFFLAVMFGGSNTDVHRIRNIDENVIATAICTTICLQRPLNQQSDQKAQGLKQHSISSLKYCYAGCLENTVEQLEQRKEIMTSQRIAALMAQLKSNIGQKSNNSELILLCRDETSLSFRIAQESFPEALFIIQIHKTMETEESLIYLSDDVFFSLDQLTANTSHNLTVIAIHNKDEYAIVAIEEQFPTLNRGFTPRPIKSIQVVGFEDDSLNKRRLIAKIAWKPSTDLTCHYDIVCFSPLGKDTDLIPKEIHDPRDLNTYKLSNLTFESTYRVGIRAKNPHNKAKESELIWETFKTPSCTEWYQHNYSICAPPIPSDFKVDIIHLHEHDYSLNLTWRVNNLYLPNFYTIRIVDLKSGHHYIKKLDPAAGYNFIPRVKLSSMIFEVRLWACSPGGCSTLTTTEFTNAKVFVREQYTVLKLVALTMAAVLCIGILFLLAFIIFRRIFQLNRCRKFRTIVKELKKDVETKSLTDFCAIKNFGGIIPSESHTNVDEENDIQVLTDDNTMEIDRKNIDLYETVGEGAFGLVRRGIMVCQTDKGPCLTREVAVKMLKDDPSTEELRAFRREIEVMKSVEKHRNIVGIIGHCTQNIKEILLLTEYCSFGNLLNFLREQWLLLHDLDNGKEEDVIQRSEEFYEHKSFELTKLNESTHHRPSVRTVENKEYFQTIPGSDSLESHGTGKIHHKSKLILCAWDLLEIAQQVALGMEFLDKHKIVHRDLAARNVLVCKDLTVKIADFGLSRDIYQENIYKKTGNDKLPIKWMALESLTHQVYTTKSDIWSFGILLYEIVSLGGTPYPSVPTNRLVHLLKSGYRMEQPKCCGQHLYDLMASCWHCNPNHRPTFAQVRSILAELMSVEPEKQIILKLVQ